MIYLKLLAYLAFTFCLFYIKEMSFFYAVLFVALGLYLFYPDRRMKRGVLPIGIFSLSVFVSNLLLFTPGRVVYEGAFLTITDSGLYTALVRATRVIGLVYGAKLLVLSSGLKEIVSALKKLSSPLKKVGISVDSFFDTLTLTLSLLPVIKEEALKRVSTSRKHRRGSLFSRLKVWVDVMVPLLLDTIRMPEVFLERTTGQNRNHL